MIRTLALLLALAPAAAPAEVDPGNWELTVTTSMSGMPQPIGPITQTRCLTAADAKDPSRVLSPGQGDCQFTDKRESPGRFDFAVACTGQFPAKGTGSVRYGPQTMEADLDLVTDAGGQKVSMKTKINGRRLGPCNR